MDKHTKSQMLDKIVKSLAMTQDDTGSILLVKVPTLVSILDNLPEPLFIELLRRIPDKPPAIEAVEWVAWFKSTCEKFEIPRERFIELAGVDKGDLSKFESSKLNFSPAKRQRLLKVLCDETGLKL